MPDPSHPEPVIREIAQRASLSDCAEGDLSAEIGLLKTNGWLTACLPQAHGGAGWGSEAEGTNAAFDALRALGRANLSVARLFEGHVNAVKLIALYASDSLRKAAFVDVAQGELLGVWGADDPSAPLAYTKDGGQMRLSGAKRFASGLALVDQAIVTVPGDEGMQLLLLRSDEVTRCDRSVWNMDGMRATQSGRYDFGDLEVSENRILGGLDDYLREPHFEGGIWRYCAAHLGAAEALLEDMRESLEARGRADDPHQQRRIVEASIAVETCRLWLLRAARAVEAQDTKPDSATLSLLAREVTETCCRDVMRIVEQALGMGAHRAGSPVERIARDLRLFLCQAAPDAKRARAAQTLVQRGVRPEFL